MADVRPHRPLQATTGTGTVAAPGVAAPTPSARRTRLRSLRRSHESGTAEPWHRTRRSPPPAGTSPSRPQRLGGARGPERQGQEPGPEPAGHRQGAHRQGRQGHRGQQGRGGGGGKGGAPPRPGADRPRPHPRRVVRSHDGLGRGRPGRRDHRRAGHREGHRQLEQRQRLLHAGHPGAGLGGPRRDHHPRCRSTTRWGSPRRPCQVIPPTVADRPAAADPQRQDPGDALLRGRVLPVLRRRALGHDGGAVPLRDLERTSRSPPRPTPTSTPTPTPSATTGPRFTSPYLTFVGIEAVQQRPRRQQRPTTTAADTRPRRSSRSLTKYSSSKYIPGLDQRRDLVPVRQHQQPGPHLGGQLRPADPGRSDAGATSPAASPTPPTRPPRPSWPPPTTCRAAICASTKDATRLRCAPAQGSRPRPRPSSWADRLTADEPTVPTLRWQPIATLLLSLFGLGVAIYLTITHFDTGGPGLRRTTAPSTARRSPPARSRRSSASRWPCWAWSSSSR